MKYVPEKKNKKPEALSIILFFSACILIYAGNVAEDMQWIFQSGAVVLMAAFIYILVRFVFTDCMYEIKQKSMIVDVPLSQFTRNELRLYIHKRQGKRGYAAEFMCDLSQINDVKRVKNTRPISKKAKRYIYVRNFKPQNLYVLSVTLEKEDYEVFLEINEDGKDFLKMLMK
ncbi:MAG: hypothetical protein IJ499_02855 [Clostridia bacterium]|nr:hypothetical protein [Clostridia bacterium]